MTDNGGANPKDGRFHQLVISYDDNGHTFMAYYDGKKLHEHPGAGQPDTPSTSDECYGVNIPPRDARH